MTSLHIEGNLIASAFTTELATGNIKGQAPEDFGFTKTDKLPDQIAKVWGEAKRLWSNFRRIRSELEATPGTTGTRKFWAVPLLTCLGYQPT